MVQAALLGVTDGDYDGSEEVIPMNVSSLEPTELLVSWTFEHNLTSYFEVMWSPPNEMTESSATTNDTSYIITDLTPRTSYTVCVQAMDANDTELGYSADVTATTSTPDSPPTNYWIVAVSVAAVVILVAAGVGIYVFRDKLRRLKPRIRDSSSRGSRSRHGPSNSPFPEVNAAAGEVRTTDLRRYIKRLEEDTQRHLEEEYELVRQQSAQHPAQAAAEDINKPKNRFRNILPFDHSRVALPLLEGDPSSDYINANYITDARGRQLFVACQGPTASTVGDFWRLVWHVGATVVVMLTNLREKGKEQCTLYWPTSEEPRITTGGVTVSRRGEAGSDDLRVRKFVLHKGKEQRLIRQYHNTSWPDFGVPRHEHHLLDLVSEVRDATPRDGSPVVVHCRAGVGRTGTFIGLWNLMDIVDTRQPQSINVQQTVLVMRECRPQMVQTPEQYLYLYKCIAVYLEHSTTWRRKASLDLSGVQVAEDCQDYILAFDNPTFTEEELDDGSEALSVPAGGVETMHC